MLEAALRNLQRRHPGLAEKLQSQKATDLEGLVERDVP